MALMRVYRSALLLMMLASLAAASFCGGIVHFKVPATLPTARRRTGSQSSPVLAFLT
jgi:hypothetical protein